MSGKRLTEPDGRPDRNIRDDMLIVTKYLLELAAADAFQPGGGVPRKVVSAARRLRWGRARSLPVKLGD